MDSIVKDIIALLPGFNCGVCGHPRCDAFAQDLAEGKGDITQCPHLGQERFAEQREQLRQIHGERHSAEKCTGLIDGYEADFEIAPLPGESSCREVLYPFTREVLKAGDIIRYRPLGCPMIHFAKILKEEHGLITVHMIGPRNRLGEDDFAPRDVGVCMVGGFEGTVIGKLPFVGQTVRFLPHHCMMRKVHSGVVIQLEGDRVIIEGIDLKVWAPPL